MRTSGGFSESRAHTSWIFTTCRVNEFSQRQRPKRELRRACFTPSVTASFFANSHDNEAPKGLAPLPSSREGNRMVVGMILERRERKVARIFRGSTSTPRKDRPRR